MSTLLHSTLQPEWCLKVLDGWQSNSKKGHNTFHYFIVGQLGADRSKWAVWLCYVLKTMSDGLFR